MQTETAPSAEPIGPFRLGNWEVRPRRNELKSGQETRHLEPKAMDLLVFMTMNAPEVVSKNAIIDSVWEGRIISEGTLTNTIAELRRALGDNARHPRFIETIPKRGYRLVAAVEPVSSSTGDDAQASPPRRRAILFSVIAAVLLASVTVTTFVVQTRRSALDPELVVVGSFVNRTGDESFDAMALLARDRLVTRLSESGLVQAIPSNVDEPGDAIDLLCSAARSAGAALAIGGSFYLHEGGIEVQAKIVDVRESAPLYAVPASIANRDDISDALDQVVQRTVGVVATHRSAHAHFQLMSHAPVFEAYQEFVAGSELFAVDTTASIHHLERAVELDPNFTSAHFRLATAYRNAGRRAEAAEVLNRVEERRPMLTDFERLWLDYFLASLESRRRDGLALLRRIEDIVPDDTVVQHLIGSNAFRLNRPREVVAAISAMTEGRGFESFVHNRMAVGGFLRCAFSHHILGNHEEELQSARTGLAYFPTDHDLLVAEARALIVLGDEASFEEAVAEVLSTPTGLTPANLLTEAAATARAHGRPDRARDLARRALMVLDDRADPNNAFFEGWVRAQALVLADELDQAQAVLETVRSMKTRGTTSVSLGVDGWLGAVAARRGDLETAHAIDSAMAGLEGSQARGWPAHYRASIAAWLGYRDQAIELLSQSRAEGWGSFYHFHDNHRVLFEPLEGMDDYEDLLHPDG
jgi:DNA-binding winged helix-turn-helix (wHTH) protein/tetratricopeptide (TPR) repeat protein